MNLKYHRINTFLRNLGGGGLVTKSCPTLATPWTVAHQALLSMGFSRQEYQSRLPCPPPGDLPGSGIKPRSPAFTAELPGKPPVIVSKRL